MSSRVLVTGPAVEPITLINAKNHLKVDVTDDDDLIQSLIKAARESVEDKLARVLITQTWNWIMDSFPASRQVVLPLPPLQSVESITYKDAAGDEQTVDSGDYIVDTAPEPGRVVLAKNASWPSAELYPASAVTFQYKAGYGDTATDIPGPIKQACLLMIGEWYENRENAADIKRIGTDSIPLGASNLLSPYRIMRWL